MLSSQNRLGLNTSAPSDGSCTITTHDIGILPESSPDESARSPLSQGTLRLRGGPRSRPRVAWDESVVDNENCGKKKSKICCIYHKPKEFDESSDESSSDQDSDPEDSRARPPHRRHHEHEHELHRNTAHSGREYDLRSGSEGSVVNKVEVREECNAYESQPKKGRVT